MKKTALMCAILFCTHQLSADGIHTLDTSKKFLSKPTDNLSNEELETFILGKSFFRIPWVEAPSATTARDGLGPLFSANACISCHPNNGSGSVYTKDGNISRSLVTRFSLKDKLDNKNGFVPDSTYGNQLSINGVKDVPYEGKPTLKYEIVPFTYPDGKRVELKKPIIGVSDLQYGLLDQNTVIAHRLAQPLIGLGMINKIKDEDILKYQDVDDKDGDGISGRPNWAVDPQTGEKKLGRFTWKASAVSLKHQVAAAFINDMGITSPLYPDENCTQNQKECVDAPKGRDEFDLPMQRLDAVTFYVGHLQIPKPKETKEFLEGQRLFESVGCTKCHVPSYEVNGQEIYPYSDFLLHDMGEGLSDDGRVEFDAKPNEWRTQPLWGVGKRATILGQGDYLHDGRAKSIEEAILWHGGEAENIKQRFVGLTQEEREKILEFLKGL